MAEYIDRKKIRYHFEVGEDTAIEGRSVAYKTMIDSMPTEDVVPVVRKSVKGYEGYYEVDQFGRVFSVDRVISVNDNGRQYNKPLKAKQMKQHIHTNGYKVVSLTKDGKSKGLFVHRIVAEAFI